jgi:hypothetical protein
MTLKEILYLAIAFPIILGLLYFLWIIIRFAFISDIKTKGAKQRLRIPDPDGVASICGFRPTRELVEFFQSADVIECLEFHLVDTRTTPPKGWFIGSFIPISPIDATEWRKITHLPGLPIADDCDGGVYYLANSGAIYLSAPKSHKTDLLVADTVEAFTKFSRMESPDDQEE